MLHARVNVLLDMQCFGTAITFDQLGAIAEANDRYLSAVTICTTGTHKTL